MEAWFISKPTDLIYLSNLHLIIYVVEEINFFFTLHCDSGKIRKIRNLLLRFDFILLLKNSQVYFIIKVSNKIIKLLKRREIKIANHHFIFIFLVRKDIF